MKDFRAIGFTILVYLLTTVNVFSQENDSHFVKSPTERLKMVLYSNQKIMVEGEVVVVDGNLINDGMFIIYKPDGSVYQTVHYDMGKIVKVTDFTEQNKM